MYLQFVFFVFDQVREYMAKMGFRKLNEMIGRCDLLEPADPLNEKVKVGTDTLHGMNKVYKLGPRPHPTPLKKKS